jgi:Kef-type K+ transport system membrane component KefB
VFELSPELSYIVLVVGLFILPRGLQRFRLPSAITSLGLGAAASIGFHAFQGDSTIDLLNTLGIVALFLFAGLEVDLEQLYRGRWLLLQHVGVQIALLYIGSQVCRWLFGLEPRPALLFALALFTPSTGFILDSLPTSGLNENERYWVKAKAVAAEIVALMVLFFTIQSTAATRLALSTGALVALVAILPPLFRIFDRVIAPFAPGTEFTFLILMALLASYLTRELGVYYLVGAFVVGLTAVRMRKAIPSLTSDRLITGVELFASFFIPFYFFKSGLHLQAEDFSLKSCAIALGLAVTVIPLRIMRVAAHRHWFLGESWKAGMRIGAALAPTLVFTIVLADILRERFALPPELFGALIIFTLITTLLPGFVLRMHTPAIEIPPAGLTAAESEPDRPPAQSAPLP